MSASMDAALDSLVINAMRAGTPAEEAYRNAVKGMNTPKIAQAQKALFQSEDRAKEQLASLSAAQVAPTDPRYKRESDTADAVRKIWLTHMGGFND